jgi:hypothetical protein
MNTKNEKFSDLISNLTEMWLLWMKFNTISHDKTLSIIDRKNAVTECEKLIDLEYQIVAKLDSFFEVKNDIDTKEKK